MARLETEKSYLEAKLERVFSFDKSIRFAVVLTPDGQPLASASRQGVAPLEPKSESETVFVKVGIAFSMGTPMNKYFGPLKTAILIREKVVIVCFSLAGKILLVSADPEFKLPMVEGLGRVVDELNIA